MALREEKYKADIPVGTGISINNLHNLNVGLKFTESELLILSEKGDVIGILDRKYFSTGKDDKGDDAPGAKSVKAPKKKSPKTKIPTTKKRTVKV